VGNQPAKHIALQAPVQLARSGLEFDALSAQREKHPGFMRMQHGPQFVLERADLAQQLANARVQWAPWSDRARARLRAHAVRGDEIPPRELEQLPIARMVR